MIKLIKKFRYDNKYDYIKTFSSKTEQESYFASLGKIIIDETNYIKVGETFNVNYEYDLLVEDGVNYIIFNNGIRDIFAFITNKEYVRKNVTRIYYEIDVVNTFLFDFSINKSFINRKVCNLSEITDFDEGIEIGEHIIESETVSITKGENYFAMFGGFKDYYTNTDGTDIKEFPFNPTSQGNSTRPCTTINGVVYPLLFLSLNSQSDIDIFNANLIDNPNLVGIIRFPKCSYSTTNFYMPFIKMSNGKIIKTGIGLQNVVTSITSATETGQGVTVAKGDITDFYPYTYYVITDGESEPLLLQPQYLSSSLNVIGRYALSNRPTERYYPNYYKGSSNGDIYNITNQAISMLPTGQNGGLETIQANSFSLENKKQNMLTNLAISGAITGASLATGNAMGVVTGLTMGANSVSQLQNVQQELARMKDIELTPSSIKSFGDVGTRKAFATDKVKIIKYTIKPEYKERVKNFISRFGNKFNNFGVIDLKSYKGYVKITSPDLDGKIDFIYLNKINEILERGVFVE